MPGVARLAVLIVNVCLVNGALVSSTLLVEVSNVLRLVAETETDDSSGSIDQDQYRPLAYDEIYKLKAK